MAVFDEVISQPPLSWAFGFGDSAVASEGDGAGDDDEHADQRGDADGHSDPERDH